MHYGAKLGYKSATVRTPDSDIFFISLHHATSVPLTIFLDVGTGKQRKVLNISELSEALGVNYCAALLGLHVFTGEDVTSAFKGKGKIIPLRKLQSYPKYLETFRTLGDAWVMADEVIQMLEAFVCLIYGFPREKSVNTCRALLLKKMVGEDEVLTVKSKVDLSRLPPCQDNLCQHVFRTNYRLAILKKANNSTIECPEPFDDNQGWIVKNNVLEPLWAKGPILPSSLIDILGHVNTEFDEKEEDEEDVDFLELEMILSDEE
ncbi:uncharacterized protein LOC127831257 [Dreissena polymorpha]|nr:uncharacterized protein LOC127831257 [Dreissena polymorpha]